jgi:hypothetical protein
VFGRSVRLPQAARGAEPVSREAGASDLQLASPDEASDDLGSVAGKADDGLRLVRCAGCRSPIGRVSPGSTVEVMCGHSGTLTMAER